MKSLCHYILIAAAAALLVRDAADAGTKTRTATGQRNRIAVVKSKYDKVDVVLQNFRIPYDMLLFRDLENLDRVTGYSALYVPSGIDNPLEDSLNVYASNYRYRSVSLKPDFYEVNRDKVARTLRRFVRKGGSVYVSGYSFELLQRAFNMFEFFDNFPFMGMPARLEANVRNDLSRFSMRNRMVLYLDHPGWVAVESAKGAEILSFASFETPRGIRSGPISFITRRGAGEILYSSYDSTVFSDFRRFNIYRIAGAHLIEILEDEAARWGQSVTGRIANSIIDREYLAMHRIDLAKGKNNIYVHSERDFFQIDIVDRNFSVIESRDTTERHQTFTVSSQVADYCYIKLYPSNSDRFGMYAVVSASGIRIFPYLQYVYVVLGIATVVGITYAVYRLFPTRGYRGRWRL
ncbi:MAG: hypothetical protein JW807_16120 [Spirochaetes bacterium]|nr:hypothetical protein [Spirochaetota bacterium]